MLAGITPRKAALGLLVLASAAQAQLVQAPLPENTYITFGGLQWAWASPVAADGSFVDLLNIRPGASTAVDLSYQSQFG